jgi:NTE family protein
VITKTNSGQDGSTVGALRVWLLTLVILVVEGLAGCAHATLNRPLTQYDPVRGLRYTPRTDQPGSSEVAVMLFFSGGGKRAAAFSYGVLKELSACNVRLEGKDCRLLDEVEVISSVSGGSFTAAFYCLYHDRIFSDFEPRFLKRNINAALLTSLATPTHWAALVSPYYGRSDLAADYFDKHLFDGATYGDLAKGGGRPLLLINATDMANGEQFTFSQARFDLLSSDLSSYSLARAVAASSAVPVLLSPITLKNYAGCIGPVRSDFLPPPESVGDQSLSRREREVRSLLRSYADSNSRPYIHLVDGVFSDNLGLRGIMDLSMFEGGLQPLMSRIQMKPPKRLVCIIVNAATRKGREWTKRENIPGAFRSIDAIADDIGGHVNQHSIDLLQPMLDEWRRQERAHVDPGDIRDYYFITVDFERLSDEKDRNFFEDLATDYVLSDKTVDRLEVAAGRLLRDSPDYQRLLQDLTGAPANKLP